MHLTTKKDVASANFVKWIMVASRFRSCTFCANVAFAIILATSADGQVDIKLSANKSEFVINEPVKLTVVFRNMSREPIRIIGVGRLGMNMEYMSYEIESPSGKIEDRYSRFFSYLRATESEYPGEQLDPADSLVTILYPRETFVTGDKRKKSDDVFVSTGEYRVRIAYRVPAVYKRLVGAGESLFSNQIVLRFREPTKTEEEILAACWTPRNASAYCGDGADNAKFDEERLRSVIAKYPDNEMTKYALLNLGRSLTRVEDGELLGYSQEGARYLQKLKSELPEFRSEAVIFHLAKFYLLDGQPQKAVDLLTSVLEQKPYLCDNLGVMSVYIGAATNSYDLYQEWLWKRKNGGKRKVIDELRKKEQ